MYIICHETASLGFRIGEICSKVTQTSNKQQAELKSVDEIHES